MTRYRYSLSGKTSCVEYGQNFPVDLIELQVLEFEPLYRVKHSTFTDKFAFIRVTFNLTLLTYCNIANEVINIERVVYSRFGCKQACISTLFQKLNKCLEYHRFARYLLFLTKLALKFNYEFLSTVA